MTGFELIIGGKLTTAVIGKVVDLGRSYLRDKYDHVETRKMLTNLEIQLPHIQSVIEAAEKQQNTSRGLTTWLEQLKDAAYEAEDVMDNFEAKRIRESIKVKGKVSEIATSSVKMVKTLFLSDNDLKELKSVVNKLDKLCMGDFVKTLQLTQSYKRKEHLDHLKNETTSNLAPGLTIFGRDREIELILDMILNVLYGDFYHQSLDDPNLKHGEGEGSSSLFDSIFKTFLNWGKSGKSMFIQTFRKGDAPEQSKNRLTTITTIIEPHSISNRKLAVIPIVGVGGVGKTAVAKKIYNNERVKEHFSLRAWVYVSENCGAKKIMQEILCSFGGVIIDPLMNLDIVETMLKETIKNHRFLLMLDDLSDTTEHIWSRLGSVLFYGEVGSVVVVTTQSRSIANTIRTLPEVTLDGLQQESFWKLFEYYAFGGLKLGDLKDQPPLHPSKQEELKLIGKQIAEKLHGLPLAGEVIGTLLSTRLEKETWEDICGSEWWNIEGARENILESIGVGYNYLDPELKHCFLFCSIFPKHYVFERERLVQMWIAQGFIQPGKEETARLDKGDIRLEDVGRKWFDKLVDRSFFQLTLSDGKYLMHDLVRDLAIAISSNEFCFVKSHDKYLPPLARHMGIGCDNSEVEWKCKDSTRLRTVILFGNWTNCSDKSISNILAKYNGLRVLDLSYIMLQKNAPIVAACELSHLRFVDLSFTGIKWIPDEFCALCHLEVLDVRGCNFERLPGGMNQLVNLRHLYACSDTISLISSIGKLTNLQELKEFRVGKTKGHKISELMDMNEISGHLLLSNLNNVFSKEEAAKSQLYKKKYLKSLELRFEYDYHGPILEVNMEVLDALKPVCSLEILKVWGYKCESFPGWVFSPDHGFCNLKVIHVSCFSLSSLPAFGELPSLELLSFHDLPFIEKVGSEFYGSSNVIFPSLKKLIFSRMISWRDWSDAVAGKTTFPHLKKLHLTYCTKLMALPLYSLTSVVELTLSWCSDLRKIQTVRMPSLAHFSITGRYSFYIDSRFKSLEVLHLTHITQVRFVGGLKSLVNLRKLVMNNVSKVLQTYEERRYCEMSQKEIDEQCLQLTYLYMCNCNFPRVGRMPSLHTLLIENSFASDPSDLESWFSQLTSLEKFEVRNCQWLRLPSTLHLLTSLTKLHIHSCDCLCSLPENGLPQNLAELYIEGCPHLIRRCQPSQGDDWHKISHIPFVHFNEEIETLQVQSPEFLLLF